MLVVGDVDFLIFRFEDGHQGCELFFRCAGEIPVNERVIGILLEQIPGDQTAGIDEVRFEVSVLSHFFIVEGWGSEDIKIFQATALQQFSDGTLQCNTEIRVRAERGKTGTVSRVEQYNADNRVFAAQRAVVCEDWESFGFQLCNGFNDCRVTRHHFGRNFRQADAFRDNAVFHIALKNFRQPLNAGFIRCVTRRHTVRYVQITDNVHRNVNGLII